MHSHSMTSSVTQQFRSERTAQYIRESAVLLSHNRCSYTDLVTVSAAKEAEFMSRTPMLLSLLMSEPLFCLTAYSSSIPPLIPALLTFLPTTPPSRNPAIQCLKTFSISSNPTYQIQKTRRFRRLSPISASSTTHIPGYFGDMRRTRDGLCD